MKVVTAAQIRDLDRRAMEQGGIPGVVLMENAGRAVVDVIAKEYGPLEGKDILVFCGTGNNGGGGVVIARHLHLRGAKVFTILVGRAESLKGDAQIHYHALPYMAAAQELTEENRDIAGFADTMDVIVDALLGTGIREAPRDLYTECIRKMNGSGRPIVAVDIPSG